MLKSLLLAALGLPLAAAAADPAPPTTEAAKPVTEIKSFAGSEQKRLVCNRGVAHPLCNLRVYQIMVESFIDGDPRANYNTGYGTSHHRGDIQGVIDSLDYIKGLGMNAIWITPIFHTVPIKRQSEWAERLDATGYFTTNYFKVDPKFGTDAQLQTLIDEMHKRDMYIFLDGAFGHYKQNVVASPSEYKPVNRDKCVAGTPDRDWYPDAGTKQACADYSSDDTKSFFTEVIGNWIQNYKIDGWRLDQAYQIPLEQWREFKAVAERVSANTTYKNSKGKLVNPLGYMVAEISWHEVPLYNPKAYGSNEAPALNSAFEFWMRDHLVATLAMDEKSEKVNQPATHLVNAWEQHDSYPDHAIPNLMLGNHDLVRFGDLIQRAGLADTNDDAYWNRHKAAFTFMAAYSGPLTLYYGEEIGQELPGFAAKVTMNCASEGICDDHVARTSGKITDLSPRQADLKNYLTRLWELRATNPALSVGSRTHVYADEALYVDLKKAGKNRVLLMMNTKPQDRTVKVSKALLGNPKLLKDLKANAPLRPSGDSFVIDLPGLSARLLAF